MRFAAIRASLLATTVSLLLCRSYGRIAANAIAHAAARAPQQPRAAGATPSSRNPNIHSNPSRNKISNSPATVISVTVPIFNVDVVVTDNDGNYLTGLKKENFRILEDGKPQMISNFATGKPPSPLWSWSNTAGSPMAGICITRRSWADCSCTS